jgi:peptide/nickel transport system ATP-binding protein
MLEIRNLSVDYKLRDGGSVQVVKDVSLEVPAGQVTALIGESGSGKTTLSGALLGLLAPNACIRSGSVLFGGVDLLQLGAEELRRFRWHKAAVVFQAAQAAFNPTLTLKRQLLDSVWDHGLDHGEARARCDALLRQVRLDPARVLPAYPHQLSGGMRQRALIAMALMLQPELLILDEPTTALDLITQSYIFDILAEIQHTQALTMILITHDLAAVSRLAHRVAVLYKGELVEVAEAQAFFDGPQHAYSQKLLHSVPDVRG